MNALNKIGGAFLALVIVILVFTGAKSETGAAVLDPLWTAVKSAWASGTENVPTVGATRDKALPSILGGLIAFVILFLLFPTMRSERGLAFAGVVGALVALLLFNPTVFA